MTQSSYFLTNGSSLEDCHTNFFALADLCGIKWRQYSCDQHFNDLNEDPILKSFTNCINANLLCVWRRVRNHNTQEQTTRDLYISYSKELWIFWYEDEPDLKELISGQLKEGEQGSWESGLSYECRTLLFKALHNLIERCLLSKGYCRLGQWFFHNKNREISDILKEGIQVTFRFNFFLHGDSNVCANVDVRQHLAVRSLTKEDILNAQQIPDGLQVLLSPFGLQGILTGSVYKDNDPNLQKFLSDWNKIYPLSSNQSKNIKGKTTTFANTFSAQNFNNIEDQSEVSNKVCEVIVGNCRMKYPMNYLFITEADLEVAKFKLTDQPEKINKTCFSETFNQIIKQYEENLSQIKLKSQYHYFSPNDTYLLKNNFNQVMYICDQQANSNDNKLERNMKSENYQNPHTYELLLKKNCNCPRCQNPNIRKHSKSSSGGSSNNSSTCLAKSKNSDKDKSMRHCLKVNSKPFHHRIPMDLMHDLSSFHVFQSSTSLASNPIVNNNNNNNNHNNNNIDSSPISANTVASINNNNNQTNVTPVMVPYKSPVSTSTSSILNTPGVESSPMSNFNIESHEHISPLPSKEDATMMNTPVLNNSNNSSNNSTNINDNSNQIGSSPKDKSLNAFDHLNNSVNNICDSVLRNTVMGQTNNNLNNKEETINIDQQLQLQQSSSINNDMTDNHRLEKKHFKRSYRYKSIYDDDSTYRLRYGLLYDFSSETIPWEEMPRKNRRFKPVIHSDDPIGEGGYADQNSLDCNRDPYDFCDLDNPDYVGSSMKFNPDLLESSLAINVNHGTSGGSDFSTNEMIVMNNNGFSGKTIENEPNRCTNSSTNKNNHNNTANGTNIIHNGIAEKNGEWTTCDMEFLNSPAEDVNERDNNNGKIVNSIMTTTVSNETAESMISAKNNSSNVLGAAELLRMFPTPPSLEGMVASPCSTYVATETANKTEKIEQINTNHPHHLHLHNHPNNNQILNINIEKIEKIEQTTIVCSTDFNDIKESALVYMPPKQSIFITSNKYAPLENIELKSTLPNHFHYKHNINNDNQPIRNQQHNQSFNRNCNISPQQNHHHYGHHHHHHHHPQQQQQQINPHNHHQAMFLNKSRPQYSLAANNLNNKINPLPFPNSMIRGASRANCQNPMIPMSPHPNHPVHRIRNQINISQQHHYPPTNMMDGGGGFNTSPMVPMGDNRRSPFMFGQQQPPSLNSPSNPNLIMNNGMGAVVKQNLQSSMMNGPSTNLYHHTMNSNQNMDSTTAVTANMMQPIAANECNSLMLNLLLSDSMFNLFRDHNFESCSICVCNMNIKGNDVGIYLPDSPQQSTNYEMCTCGFSAITNRHRSNFSGLFYEDEVEITGIYYDPIELSKENVESSSATTSLENYIDREVKKCLNDNDENFLKLILQQSTTIYPSLSTLSTIMYSDRKPNTKVFNLKDKNVQKDPSKLIYDDCSAVILASLQMTRFDLKQNMLMPTFNQNFSHSKPLLHEWQFKYSKFPVNNHEVMLTLKRLHPLMQESVQRKGSVNEVTYNNVIGPLTWRQFHRLASRGTECQCEPQPIPSLMVGYDKECVALSPFGLKFWEKLSLEPYAITRDVYYVVITPNEEHNLPIVRSFFKELSTTYEILRLGRHSPLSKISADGGKDGIHMLGVENKNEKYDFQMDDWFNQLGESNLANHLRSYAQAIYDLLPFLNITERGHFDPKSSSSSSSTNTNEIGICNSGKMSNNITVNGNASNSYVSNSQSMLASSTSSTYHSQTVNQQKQSIVNNNYNSLINNNTNNSENQVDRLLNDLDGHGSNNNQNPNHNNNMDNCNNHGNQNNNNLNSNASFQPYDEEEDPHKYPSIVIYVLESFSSLDKDIAKLGAIGLLKTFSIMKKYFPEPIRNNIHMQMLPKNSIICNDKDFRDYPREPQLKELSFSVYSLCKQQLVMQSNIKSLTGLGPAASFEKFLKNKTTHLYRTPLHTSPYILAPMKDKQTELGEMFGDRRERTQILYCSYCLTEDKKWLIASCTNDKGDILHTKVININIPNRTRRKKASARRLGLDKLMRFIQTVMSESILPWRLIIGRVGRIGHGELKDWTFLLSKKSLLKYSRQLREMCDQCRHLNPNEQPAIYSACLISLEADTALRVFPNYYTPDEKFSSSCNLSTPEDASCTHILVFPTSATTQSQFNHPNLNNIESDLGWLIPDPGDMPDEMDFLDFLVDGDMDGQQPDSPGGNRHQTLFFNASNSFKNTSLEVDQDEPAQLLQQPLALAFYVSTAKIGPLPRWFWAHCPHLENLCPVFLKSALLIHTPSVHSNSDDILQTNNRDCHSLDSNLTNDVLRYSLEGYNALSWLVLDPVTNDRLSCLPLHIQVMMQLYHTIQTLVQ